MINERDFVLNVPVALPVHWPSDLYVCLFVLWLKFSVVLQHEQQRVVELERLNTFKLMLEKEAQFVETKRGDLVRGYNPAGAIELASAEKRVRELQQKCNQMANRLGLPTSESQPLLVLYLFCFSMNHFRFA